VGPVAKRKQVLPMMGLLPLLGVAFVVILLLTHAQRRARKGLLPVF
jgi:hypothetical protein